MTKNTGTYTTKMIVLAVVISAAIGSISTSAVLESQTPSEEELIKDFYLTENAVHVSPHSLRGKMDKGINDYVLVDLRSAQEYEQEHIIGAVSIPAYKDPDTSDYGAVNRITGAFAALPTDKEIIVYCYSMPCMTGRKVGEMLTEHNIYVKHLNIGWNEWRYFWNLWNHEHEWNKTDVENYIATGKEPGVPIKRMNSTACPITGSFGC